MAYTTGKCTACVTPTSFNVANVCTKNDDTLKKAVDALKLDASALATLGENLAQKLQLNLGASIITNVDSTNICGADKLCNKEGVCNATLKACVCNSTKLGSGCLLD